MLRIGLTGGIASGKSTASARLGELGARVIDHDELARRAVAPGAAALSDIVREFGDRVIVNDELDRAALAAIVFSDDHARRRLNAIVHPYVIAMGSAADKQARREGVDVIVHDIPLLVESGQGKDFDLVVTISAPEPVRIRRQVEARGLSRADAAARLRAQATDEERAAVADVELDGSGSVADLEAQVDSFWSLHVPR
ncbi:dephospho-CoA kinase [Demequina sp.]|uniref:dephospho-CoA kinase n=1 Tax=Demequina sp. TaxID=2050685 RepID=UPI0025D362DA|nr:dephospho-CoA kinase [Demequina sp.]